MVHVYIESIGVELTLKTSTDLTTAASVDIHVRKPDMSAVSWDPTIDNVTLGILKYTTAEGDLDQAGDYILQVRIWLSNGYFYKCDAVKWKIYDDFQIP